MTTPITKRLHMNAFKKASVAKQTKKFSAKENVQDAEGNLYEGTASGNTGSAGRILSNKAPKAKPGGTAGVSWERKMIDLYEGGTSIDELVKKKHGTKEGFVALFKGKTFGKNAKRSTGTPGNVDFGLKPKLTEAKKGSTVDTSTSWSAADERMKVDSITYNLQHNKKKMEKYKGAQNEKGEWVIGIDDPTTKQKRKFEEYKSKYMINKLNLDRALAQATAGKDAQITARFEYGTTMDKAQKGGQNVKANPDTKTIEKFKEENKAKANAGSLQSSGDTSEATVNNAMSNSGDAFTEGLKQKSAQVNPFKDKDISNTASDVKSMTRDFSTSAPIYKRSKPGTSMLKKSGMKMGGFGSKTYKK
jgi:hypothetical protein